MKDGFSTRFSHDLKQRIQKENQGNPLIKSSSSEKEEDNKDSDSKSKKKKKPITDNKVCCLLFVTTVSGSDRQLSDVCWSFIDWLLSLTMLHWGC